MRLILLPVLSAVALAAKVPSKLASVQNLFDECMGWLDTFYDPDAGHLYDLAGEAALRHTVVESAWYALGLVIRNEGDGADLVEAEKIVNALIAGQHKVEGKQWYGTFQRYPEEPQVGTDVYPSRIYSTWDPNWRGFVGTTFVMMLEEYSHLLSNATQEAMIEALERAVVGDTYRVGGVNGDNLYPGYSNPAIMRAFTSGWLGRRINDENMTVSGEKYANEIIELFNITDTLSEFNSGTYTGISLFGLTLWSIYIPEDSVMRQNGPSMIRKTWDSVRLLWHPKMKNLAGPWDRAYGFDMNRYFSIMGVWFWAYLGKENSSMAKHVQATSHSKDQAWATVITLLADKQAALLPENYFDDFKTFQGEHFSQVQVWYPPYDLDRRNVTTWLSEKLTIGAQSISQRNVGGPTNTAFTPAGVQWMTGGQVGWLILRPTEKKIQANVTAGRLDLTYPEGTNASTFTLAVSTFRKKPMFTSLADIPGIKVAVSGNVNPTPKLTFSGWQVGGTLQSFDAWIFTFSMPAQFDGKPNLVLDLEATESMGLISERIRTPN